MWWIEGGRGECGGRSGGGVLESVLGAWECSLGEVGDDCEFWLVGETEVGRGGGGCWAGSLILSRGGLLW